VRDRAAAAPRAAEWIGQQRPAQLLAGGRDGLQRRLGAAGDDDRTARVARGVREGARGRFAVRWRAATGDPWPSAGRAEPALESIAAACQKLRWPLLADPLSGARRGRGAIAHYEDLLRMDADARRPDLVVRCGDLPTCKPLREWLAGLADDVVQVAFDPQSVWQDPAGVVAVVLDADPAATLDGVSAQLDGAVEDDWLAGWRLADERAGAAIDDVLGEGLSEPAVARELGRRLPADATLFVASSMPIRDVERFTPVRADPPRVLSNRGANGIDGTVSSAFGAAAVSAGPVVLLIGDVALAHDIGGLLAGRRLGLALTIVVLNNDGGGIFEFLPIAAERDVFEQHVATPHGLDFVHAAALYGCEHTRVDSLDAFATQLDAALAGGATSIIEVRGDRSDNLALHRRMPGGPDYAAG